MAPDQVGPDEDTGVTALSNCGAIINTTVFVTVPASPFPIRVSYYFCSTPTVTYVKNFKIQMFDPSERLLNKLLKLIVSLQ